MRALVAALCITGLFCLVGCDATTRYVYGDSWTITGKQINTRYTEQYRGEIKYTVHDGAGYVVFWSNKNFEVGDKLALTKVEANQGGTCGNDSPE